MKKFQIIILFLYAILLILYIFVFIRKEEVIEEMIAVEIKGAVIEPGIYSLKSNSRVSDLINISGGLNDKADISSTNMSKKLEDEMVVVIYTNDEIKEMQKSSTSGKLIENECVCPRINNSGCFDEIINNSESVINKTGKVSLNTGTMEELLTIPGIGETKAKLIIEYREKYGFKSVEEIMNVKGIGSATFEKIKSYITL